MVLSVDNNNHTTNIHSSDADNNNIDKFAPVNKGIQFKPNLIKRVQVKDFKGTPVIKGKPNLKRSIKKRVEYFKCNQKSHKDEICKSELDSVELLDNVNNNNDDDIVDKSVSLEVSDVDKNQYREENIDINVIATASTSSQESPSVDNPDQNEAKHAGVHNRLEYFNMQEAEPHSESLDINKYGNVVIMEFLGKTQELVSMHHDNDIYEDIMDDVFTNSEFFGACNTDVPLRCIESLPSIYKSKTKKYGGPKMVAFHVIKPEKIPELLKVNKLHVSQVWEFEDKENDTIIKFTPEEEFPVICKLPDPVARSYNDLPLEVWGDSVNKDEKEIVKFNNTQLMKETRLLMISDYTSDNHKVHEYFLGICNECSTFPTGGIELSRCGGCQLVAYCSRDCQKKNWKKHRDICKKMPVKKGRNVFARGLSGIRNEESWRNFIFDLDDRARNAWKSGNQEESFPEELIYWGRYCNVCLESQMENLFDCACGCVRYCSKEHKNVDMDHLEFCHALYLCTQVYKFHNLYPGKVYLPYNQKVYDVFKPLTCMLDFLKMCRAEIEEVQLGSVLLEA
ncbi:unnamed protein product [Meganyctiphanes norvegica]|uniref:MYND-type domain-containing protein n=1 Tax=Meganyctiphanes norvegica TaxID=48144 RepID=A0AAV2QID4_MEGNR